ncbi:AraC family transcriptional regulator [Hymenobacter sp. J193]|uniref:helix-turn-helix domain-containing protein n=1 Tax=Hymenobacter sp. J193 TaxID=2898429 RepID=UPI002151F0F6|nr:AraC family transcriptional regulator [Hymenobacter sp. J193]MCR5888294.1 AraC family transcriptional regulator [Hymenobacter sp. J193]
MQVELSHAPFEILVEDVTEWRKRPEKHNFFELVLVEEGQGRQCINYQYVPYHQHSIFLLPPLNCHSFEVLTPTRFLFVRFTNQVFDKSRPGEVDFEDWFRKMSYILVNYNRVPGDIIRSGCDKEHLIHLLQLVRHEHARRDKFSAGMIQSCLVTILNILARNIEGAFMAAGGSAAAPRFQQVLNHVQHHLFDNEQLRVARLAEEFNVSATYFGEYFRRNAGESLQEYVLKSRLKVAEARLLYSGNSVKEIAYELGFSDASHLSRLFKKYHGYTIQAFKQRGAFDLLTAGAPTCSTVAWRT